MSGRVEVIAFPGTSGSFSGAAAQEAFPNGQCVGFPTFPEAAKAVIKGLADYALLPVENSFAGAVLPTYSLLEKLPLHIVGETMKAVRHNLLGVPGATLAGIRRIASHPQAIAQCSRPLRRSHRLRPHGPPRRPPEPLLSSVLQRGRTPPHSYGSRCLRTLHSSPRYPH